MSDPSVATKAPKTDTLHGDIRQDDYFWLREKDNPDVAGLSPRRECLYRRGDEADGGLPGVALPGDAGAHQGGRLLGALPARRALLLLAHREGQAVPDLLPQGGQPRRARGGHARSQRAGRGAPVLLPRRLRGQRRRQSPRLLDRRHRLPRVHALRQGPAHGPGPARHASRRCPPWPGPPTTRRIFYVTEDEAKRPYRLWRHRPGIVGSDARLRGDRTQLFRIGVERSRSRAYLFLGTGSFTTSEWRYLPADDPAARLADVHAAREGPRVRGRPRRRPLLHPHQRRRPAQLPPRLGARRTTRAPSASPS